MNQGNRTTRAVTRSQGNAFRGCGSDDKEEEGGDNSAWLNEVIQNQGVLTGEVRELGDSEINWRNRKTKSLYLKTGYIGSPDILELKNDDKTRN